MPKIAPAKKYFSWAVIVAKLLITFLLVPMWVLAPGSPHTWPSSQPPIDTSENFWRKCLVGGVLKNWNIFRSIFSPFQPFLSTFHLFLKNLKNRPYQGAAGPPQCFSVNYSNLTDLYDFPTPPYIPFYLTFPIEMLWIGEICIKCYQLRCISILPKFAVNILQLKSE